LTVQGAALVVDVPDGALEDAAGAPATLFPPEHPVSAMRAIAVLATIRFTLAPYL